MTPICFYHRADYDGVCSAAIVKKFVPDCELYGIDYGDPFPWDKVMDGPQVSAAELEAGSGLPRRQVFMVDFSLKPDEMKRLAEVSDLVWIDHHKSAIDGYNRSAGFGMCPHECLLQSQFSACELCWLWFTGQSCDLDSPALEMPEAVRLLGRYDVWDAENPEWDRIEAFQFGMRSLPAAMDPTSSCGFCWNDLLSGGLSCAAIADRGYAILSYRDQEAKALCADGCHDETIYTKDFVPVRADGGAIHPHRLVCLNTLQRGSWLFKSVWDPEKHDAMCVYGQLKDGRWRVSLYSTKEEVDCGAVCKALGGGGHKGAAGFICDRLPWESRNKLEKLEART